MERLEALAPSDVVRKGAQLSAFFKEDRYRRRQGERLAEWVSRWDEGLDKLRTDGVDFAATGPLCGWWFLQHAALSEDRIEMVRASVPLNREFDLVVVKSAVLHLFPNLHEREGRQGAPQSAAWRARLGRRTVSAYEARASSSLQQEPAAQDDAGDDDVDDVDDDADDDGGFYDCVDDAGGETSGPVDALEVDALVREELEALAEDLEHGDIDFSGSDQQALEEATTSLSRVAESLETVRSLRGRLRGCGKGKGKGKGKGRRTATSIIRHMRPPSRGPAAEA